MTRVICFDLETTGFDYARGERVIEIGAVEIVDGKITDNTFHQYINPDGKIISTDSYMVHKLSNEFLSDKPKFADVAQSLLDFIGDSTVVAHNGIDFDFPFINSELTRCGLPTIPPEQQVDSIVVARHKVFGPKTYTLDSLAKFFGVSLTARADAHGALIDADILARVYLEIMASETTESITEVMEKQHAAFLNVPKPGATFPHRTFALSDAEIAAHTEFIGKNVKEALWNNPLC